jgi:hypothetical protein
MTLLQKSASQSSADKARCARDDQPHGFVFVPPQLTRL